MIIVAKVKQKSELILWKNDHEVINWFKNLEKGPKVKFVQFDIDSFYPFISKELLNKTLEYKTTMVPVRDPDLEIIYHARKSLLFSGSGCWVKNMVIPSTSPWELTTGRKSVSW